MEEELVCEGHGPVSSGDDTEQELPVEAVAFSPDHVVEERPAGGKRSRGKKNEGRCYPSQRKLPGVDASSACPAKVNTSFLLGVSRKARGHKTISKFNLTSCFLSIIFTLWQQFSM